MKKQQKTYDYLDMIPEVDIMDEKMGSLGYRLPKCVKPTTESTLQYRALYVIMDKEIPYRQLPLALHRKVENLENEKYKGCVFDINYYSEKCFFCPMDGLDAKDCRFCINRRRGLEVYIKNKKKLFFFKSDHRKYNKYKFWTHTD